MHPLEQQVTEFWPSATNGEHAMLICCSGGPDSTALVRLFARIRTSGRLAVVHYNHRLRGADSDGDEQFVRELCQAQKLEFYAGHAEDGEIVESSAGEGLEAAARHARYRFILTLAQKIGARYVATGHNRDDHIETVLHNIIRGTGLVGLAGIPFVRVEGEAVSIIRPLLASHRTTIESYLTSLAQPTRHDVHNDQRKFRRNQIRHEILPLLESTIHPGVRGSLSQLAQLASDAQEAIHFAAETLLQACNLRRIPDGCELDLHPLPQTPQPTSNQPAGPGHQPRLVPVHVRREMFVLIWKQMGWPLQDMTFEHWHRLAELFEAAASNRDQAATWPNAPGGIRVHSKSSGRVSLTRQLPRKS